MLVYFGIIKLENCKFSKLQGTFPLVEVSQLLQTVSQDVQVVRAEELKEGPLLGSQESFVLRSAALDVCERISAIAREMELEPSLDWIRRIRPSQLHMWLWSVAKDRLDYRILPRFTEVKTIFH
jgi:hypothetical protein